MGWTTFNYNGKAKDYFTDMIERSEGLELVDIAIKNFRTAYLAVRVIKSGYVFCQTFMIHRAPKSYENFGYKPIYEFAGPVESECPERILNKLSPLSEIEATGDYAGDSIKWAQEWRNRCKESIAFSKRLSKGEVVKTKNPISFTSGAEYQYFKRENRKWYAIADYGTKHERSVRVNLRGSKYMSFEFV
jgi:hypothetical protein